MCHEMKMSPILAITVIGVILITSRASALEIVTVEAKTGTFNGYVRTFQGYGEQIKSDRFLGIPYAKPPVGNLRFKKPQKKDVLDKAYDALSRKPGCLQLRIGLGGKRNPGNTMKNSVDCLYLNMYRPHGTTSESKLPVIIAIHGGGYVIGQSDTYPADVFSVYGEVIVVVINYRLNIWGFLSTGDENLPGNLGLWDQHFAIQWVHDNIVSFGGDPNAVTILGLSAGSASVIYQGLFPGNKGLFQRMVAQSGSITCPWSFQANPLSVAKRLGSVVGCDPNTSSKELAACLTGKTDEELDAALNDPDNKFITFPMELVTTVDGEFIPASPNEIFHGSSDEVVERRKHFASYDLLTGVTSGEGLMMISRFVGVYDAETFTLNREQFEKETIPEIVNIMFGEGAPKLLIDLLIAEYTNWEDPNNDTLTRESFLKLSSDYVFNIQAIDTADLHNSLSDKDTYFYFFDANPSQHLLTSVTWSPDTNHADDWNFLFGFDNQDDGVSTWMEPYGKSPEQWELELSKAVMKMFANFARSGNPNRPAATTYGTTNVPWPKYDAMRQYVIIRQNGTSVGNNPMARAAHFWDHLLPRVEDALAPNVQDDNGFCDKDGC